MIELITNEIFLSSILAAIIAQNLKALVDRSQSKKFNRRSLFRAAGMPSSHTATVIALSGSVFLIEGITTISIIVFIFSAITIRDVIGDKIFATHQEKLINTLIKDLIKHKKIQRNHLIGHSVLEVFFGIIVGLFSITIIFYIF